MPSQVTVHSVGVGELPLYNQDEEEHPLASVQKLKSEIAGSHGLLFVTPEYNRSIPGVLKNALDHGSRPYGKNVWAGKPAGILGVSPGAAGTAMAQQHLRNVLAYLDVPTMGQPEAFIQARPELFDKDGQIGERHRPFLQSWTSSFVAWVERWNSVRY